MESGKVLVFKLGQKQSLFLTPWWGNLRSQTLYKGGIEAPLFPTNENENGYCKDISIGN